MDEDTVRLLTSCVALGKSFSLRAPVLSEPNGGAGKDEFKLTTISANIWAVRVA